MPVNFAVSILKQHALVVTTIGMQGRQFLLVMLKPRLSNCRGVRKRWLGASTGSRA